jgi:hypothetical protein
MSEWADHKFRAAVLREGAAAIVAENDRAMWATKPGKHWAADLLNTMAATSDAVVEQGALPVPVGAELEAQSLPLRVVSELNDMRMRLAGMANPPREVFLALYEGAEPELFTTVEAARECCDDLAKTDAHDRYWDWTVNECGIHIQFWTHRDDDRPLSETSGSVTPIVVQGDDDLSELEHLRKERDGFRDQRNAVFATNERLLAEVQESDQARLHAENDTRTVQREAEALRARVDEVERKYTFDTAELKRRIAELEAERHTTNEALDDAVQALRSGQAQREALAERLRAGQQWKRGRNPELVSENLVSQSELRAIFGIPLVAPWDDAEAGGE